MKTISRIAYSDDKKNKTRSISRDDELQGESSSITTQRSMLRLYAKEHHLNVIDEYIDDGWSGTNFDRPSFQRMIEDIEAGKINCVVTKDLSRLGRNYIMTGQYTELYFPTKMLVCTNFTDEEVSCPLLDEWKAGEVWIRNYEDDREGNILRPYEAVIIAFTGK